jgi:ATP-binding cassette, subfamily B, bacterial
MKNAQKVERVTSSQNATDESSSTMGIFDFLKTLYRYLKPYRAQTFLLLVLLLINTAFLMGWPLSFKFLIDKGIVDRNWRVLITTLSVLTAGVLIAAVAGIARGYLYAYLSSNILKDIRQKVFEHLQRLSMSYYTRTSTGDIMARFSSDLTSLENVVTNAAPTLIMQGLGVLIGSIVLFTVEWRIALITLVGLLLCVTLPRRLARKTAKMGYQFKNKEARLAQTVQENISAQPVVKAFGLTKKAIHDFAKETTDLANISLNFSFSADNVERIPTIIILIFEILVIGAGVILVFQRQITLGTLVALHTIYIHISFSVTALTKVVPVILRSVGGLQRIEDLLAESPDVVEKADAPAIQPFSSDITFQDVSFSYSNDNLTLNRINLKIPKGSSVAFVGPSGCGKSTILNLLLRFYEPKLGAVFIDGEDGKEINAESLRCQMAVVFQESFLFNASIRENIRLGKPEASEEEIRSAAEAAGIHDSIVRMTYGYDTPVGERGSHLSGGQRQRIAIARALLRNPQILILDEATSALDPETEHAINQTLANIGKGRTVISVTHRLSSATNADSIFLLKDGSIIEQGKHQELLGAEGLYTQLWQKQTGFSFSDGSAQVQASRLKHYPIFENVDSKLLEEIASLFVTESYPANRVVVREGAPGNRFYLIAHGKVSVLKNSPDGPPKTVSVLEDGDYFGEIALIKNIPRSATIRTLTPCVMLSLHRDIFENLLDRAPGLREKLEQAIVVRISND